MTIHVPVVEHGVEPFGQPGADAPTRAEAEAALALLRRYAEHAPGDPLDGVHPALAMGYDGGFAADAGYRATLPDVQNGPATAIRGEDRVIQHVGISGFRVPLRVATRGGARDVDASVTGTVSLAAGAKGINMSRILRSFYPHAGAAMGFEAVEAALDDYLRDLGAEEARILLRFALPLEVTSLRSGLAGWQYYDCAMEVVQAQGARRRLLHLDYVYSSTCPCSLELAEHARRTRGRLATPHSQRSVARLSVEVAGDVLPEDLIDACRAAVPTETQVMVKREDEQAFAELNAANPIFVEDAARLFARAIRSVRGTGDFRVAASHQESLHSHDAVSVLTHGPLLAAATLEPRLFGTLRHGG